MQTTEADRKFASRRGVITAFSRKSRKRLIEKQAMVHSWDGAYFCTATLSDDVSHKPEDFKRWHAALRKRLLRRFPRCGGIVRVEWKPRLSGALVGQQAPHLHAMLRGIDMHPVLFRRWFQRAWSEVVYETGKPPRKLRTRCDVIHSRKHAARYASKYAAKADDFSSDAHNPNVGRHWLTFGMLNVAPLMKLTLSARQVVELRRMVARWMNARGSSYSRRIARGSPHHGFAALGLGALSEASAGRTIERMLQTL